MRCADEELKVALLLAKEMERRAIRALAVGRISSMPDVVKQLSYAERRLRRALIPLVAAEAIDADDQREAHEVIESIRAYFERMRSIVEAATRRADEEPPRDATGERGGIT